jgi:hypothetical protein
MCALLPKAVFRLPFVAFIFNLTLGSVARMGKSALRPPGLLAGADLYVLPTIFF